MLEAFRTTSMAAAYVMTSLSPTRLCVARIPLAVPTPETPITSAESIVARYSSLLLSTLPNMNLIMGLSGFLMISRMPAFSIILKKPIHMQKIPARVRENVIALLPAFVRDKMKPLGFVASRSKVPATIR